MRVSSTPRFLDSSSVSLEYWIARRSLSSGGRSADPLAGDDEGHGEKRAFAPYSHYFPRFAFFLPDFGLRLGGAATAALAMMA
jgi:hypothetical protein